MADRRFADDDEAEMELLNTVNGSMATKACGSEYHEQSDRDRDTDDFKLVFLNIALSAMRGTCNRIALMGSHARLRSSWRSRSVRCSWRATPLVAFSSRSLSQMASDAPFDAQWPIHPPVAHSFQPAVRRGPWIALKASSVSAVRGLCGHPRS